MPIAVGGTFYNGEYYLPSYFEHLLALDYPKKETHLYFVYSESSDKTKETLSSFATIHELEYASISVVQSPRKSVSKDQKQAWFDKLHNIVEATNLLCEISDPHDLIIIDQDILVPKDTIDRLITLGAKGASIASGLTLVAGFEVQYKLADGNILCLLGLPLLSAYMRLTNQDLLSAKSLFPISRTTTKFQLIYLPKNLSNKCFEVSAVGTALVYLKRSLLKKLKFSVNEADTTTQDMTFCLEAGRLKEKIMVDTGLWYDHLHYNYRKWTDNDGRIFVFYHESTAGIDEAIAGILAPPGEGELLIPKDVFV